MFAKHWRVWGLLHLGALGIIAFLSAQALNYALAVELMSTQTRARMSPASKPTEINHHHLTQRILERDLFDDGEPSPGDPPPRQDVVRPRFKEGRMDGLRITRVAPGGLLDRLGLERGDTLHALDGVRFTSPGAAFRALDALPEVLEGPYPRSGTLQLEATLRGDREPSLLQISPLPQNDAAESAR